MSPADGAGETRPGLDVEISCEHCGDAFVFSAGERAFYAERGLVPPKRCPKCREARKAEGRRVPDAFDPSPQFEALCGACGATTLVPFKPTGERPVYCEECFRHR